ncbi:tripartite tricarboxylate transporter TctB family protein [Psychromonas sp. 14N.309.X.WAT.B.A12]|uniref:tripartite tricarboxylate transporter TctB family protein n=1 Tax=unclassified Psychromonas TaxID=2614957 RepID=UPI0025B033FD|nr:tripartite tricarboxylate transporter TctB family protein [Psychromonas sp. 14N.309.X.WAT.B.A12]
MMLNRHLVLPSFVIILSLVILGFITQFPEPLYQASPVGAGFFPTVIVVIQILICCVLIIQHQRKKQVEQEQPLLSSHSIFGFTLLVGYAALITLVGYLPASLIGFTYYLIYYRVKKPIYYVVAWVFVLAIYFLFSDVFIISLPEGLLFF